MDRRLKNRVEAFGRSKSERSFLSANIKLAELTELTSLDQDWQTILAESQTELQDAMVEAKTMNDFWRAKIALDISPFYTLPLLDGTIDPGILKKNIRKTRKQFIQSAVTIGEDVRELRRVSAIHGADEAVTTAINDLVGIGSETSVIAALLSTDSYRRGYIPVPSFPWEDRDTLGLLQYRYNGDPQINTTFDVTLLPLNDANLPEKIQVKTSGSSDKSYASDITVVNCATIVETIKRELPARDRVSIATLPDLFGALPNSDSKIRASRKAGELIWQQIFADDMQNQDDSLAG